MDLKDFTLQMAFAVQDKLPGVIHVQPQTVCKNNGVVLHGLLFRQEGFASAPAIYMEAYYRAWKEGAEFPRIAEEIAAYYQEHALQEEITADFFKDYARMKETIVYKLVNFNRNQELLEDIPYVPMLDLAIVFYCLIEHPQLGTATIMVRNSYLDLWKITPEELYEAAKYNTPRLLRAKIHSMQKLLQDWMPESDQLESDMYVLTNQKNTNGAASILYPNLMEACAKFWKTDFYLLPSSVHEMILLPDAQGLEKEELHQIVMTVNRTKVIPQEILSDTVYFYSRKEKKVIML